jgi:hypothetical protein
MEALGEVAVVIEGEGKRTASEWKHNKAKSLKVEGKECVNRKAETKSAGTAGAKCRSV